MTDKQKKYGFHLLIVTQLMPRGKYNLCFNGIGYQFGIYNAINQRFEGVEIQLGLNQGMKTGLCGCSNLANF